MVKRIKSLAQIKKQIGLAKLKIKKAKARDDLEMKRQAAEQELKILSRSTSTSRNIVLARRTGRGLKIIGKAAFKFGKKHFKRIRDQQLRDEAVERRQIKLAKKTKKKIKRSAKKIRRNIPGDVFGGLDF